MSYKKKFFLEKIVNLPHGSNEFAVKTFTV